MEEEITIRHYDPEAEEGYIDGQRAKRPRSWLAPIRTRGKGRPRTVPVTHPCS